MDLITTSPTREALFQYFSQISYDQFPEFILDILVKVEGHTKGDVTDGPGDEKQDIITYSPLGKKCLTQCKHKEKVDGKYSGDELDRLVVACMRKGCSEGIFVTNGDISPQAKGYVNDQEYSRGMDEGFIPITVDYWNGYKIWEKIKNNQDIINKWFSGMVQAHGLRTFKFDITWLAMPFDKDGVDRQFESDIKSMVDAQLFKSSEDDSAYHVDLDSGVHLKLKKFLVNPAEWDIHLSTFRDSLNFWRHWLPALNVEVSLPESAGKFIPASVKENVVKYLFERLPIINDSVWRQIIASQGKSFVFLHDIGEPRQFQLDGSRTFVQTFHNSFAPELIYCDLENEDFRVVPNEDGEKSIFFHRPTGIYVIQLFEQVLNPVQQYDFRELQENQLEELQDYEFKAVDNINSAQMMRIRRILDVNWVAFQYNNAIVWAYAKDTKKRKIELTEKKLEVLGFETLLVKEETKQQLIAEMKDARPEVGSLTITELSDTTKPIDLMQRGFWLYQDLKTEKPIDENAALELLKFKFHFENLQGYDHMAGVTNLKSHTSELPAILCDMMSIRCDNMVDIAILPDPIVVNQRVFPRSTKSSNELALEAIASFQEMFKQVKDALKGYL